MGCQGAPAVISDIILGAPSVGAPVTGCVHQRDLRQRHTDCKTIKINQQLYWRPRNHGPTRWRQSLQRTQSLRCVPCRYDAASKSGRNGNRHQAILLLLGRASRCGLVTAIIVRHGTLPVKALPDLLWLLPRCWRGCRLHRFACEQCSGHVPGVVAQSATFNHGRSRLYNWTLSQYEDQPRQRRGITGKQ